MVKFCFVTLEGFGSFLKEFTYYLDSPGINLITGQNGAGKTTIFSALSWCLYGQALKEKAQVSPWEDILPKEFNGTRVAVQFFVGDTKVVVVRCKDYSGKIDGKAGGNKLFLTINNYLEPLRDKKDVQARIIELLGMSYNLFKNSIAFGQNLTRLLREPGPKQKELFDEAFDITYINKAREKAAKYFSEINIKDDKILSKLEGLNELINQAKLTYEGYKEQKEEAKEAIKEITEELKENSEKVRAMESPEKSKELLQLRSRLQEKRERSRELEQKWFKLDFTHEQEKAEITAISRSCKELAIQLAKPEPICDRCGQVIKGSSATLHKGHQRTELNIKRAELSAKRSKGEEREAELVKMRASLKKLNKWEQEFKEVESRLQLQKINAQLKENYLAARPKLEFKLKSLKSKVEELNLKLAASPISDLDDQKSKLTQEHLKLEKELKLHRWLIDDPLSNKGLKAFIFKAMLESVNTNLQKYGKFLGYSVRFSIDLDSGNKNFEAQIYSSDNIRIYEDLSGGQKQLVDVALAFAIHDTITETKKLNILLMDEVFESLDADNIELVSELIQHKSKGISIHLISHQAGLQFSQVTKITKLNLSNGTTAVG